MTISGHMWLYIAIYIYIYVLWREMISLSLPVMTVARYLLMLELSALTPSIVDIFFGTGLMKVFLWTVGSFYVFGEKLDLTCFLPVRSSFFEKTQISILIIYLQRSIIVIFGKRLLFVGERLLFLEKGVYFFEIPIVDTLCRSIVQIVQIVYFNSANSANSVFQ